jgi:hypothetical protein
MKRRATLHRVGNGFLLKFISAKYSKDTEDGNEMSRSSSVSTKDRSQSKKPKASKQRRDDSESFDVRSQYTPFYTQPQMPTWTPTPQYSPVGPQPFNGPVQNTYQHPMPAQFGPPTQQFNTGQMNNGNMQAYNNMPQVSGLDLRVSKFIN